MLDEHHANDPAAARGARARSHGIKYLQCGYAVTIAGKRHRYTFHSHTTTPTHADLDPALCDDHAVAQAAADRLLDVTRACTDLQAGAYYGERI